LNVNEDKLHSNDVGNMLTSQNTDTDISRSVVAPSTSNQIEVACSSNENSDSAGNSLNFDIDVDVVDHSSVTAVCTEAGVTEQNDIFGEENTGFPENNTVSALVDPIEEMQSKHLNTRMLENQSQSIPVAEAMASPDDHMIAPILEHTDLAIVPLVQTEDTAMLSSKEDTNEVNKQCIGLICDDNNFLPRPTESDDMVLDEPND
jgi:hypothetical protein